MNAIIADAQFVVSYPFVRDTYNALDPDTFISVPTPTWKPGVRHEYTSHEGDSEAFADGVGQQVIRVVSIHKPGKYPERVFFVRQWIDPDGRTFGKPKLRVKIRSAFRRLIAGYGYEYQVKGCEQCKAQFWASRDHREHAATSATPMEPKHAEPVAVGVEDDCDIW